MTPLSIVFAALLASAPGAAIQHGHAAAPAAKSAPAAKADPDAPSPKLEHLLQSCDAHKFETTVHSSVDGKPHDSKVKMCGTEGQSDSDWIGTLKDAISKLEANRTMEAATREQIIAAVKAEIARLEAAPSQGDSAAALLTPRADAPSASMSDDYSVLPTLPPPPTTPVQRSDEAAPAVAAGSSAARPAPVVPAVKPKLSISCISPDLPGGGDCISLSRDTLITVKAGEAIDAGVSLRFLRKGEDRGEVALGALRKGQSVHFALPSHVCSGVVSTEIEMEVVRSGQAVDRQGPYLLRC